MADLDAIRKRFEAMCRERQAGSGISSARLMVAWDKFADHAPGDIAVLLAEVEQLRFQFDQQQECGTALLAEVERLRAELAVARQVYEQAEMVLEVPSG